MPILTMRLLAAQIVQRATVRQQTIMAVHAMPAIMIQATLRMPILTMRLLAAQIVQRATVRQQTIMRVPVMLATKIRAILVMPASIMQAKQIAPPVIRHRPIIMLVNVQIVTILTRFQAHRLIMGSQRVMEGQATTVQLAILAAIHLAGPVLAAITKEKWMTSIRRKMDTTVATVPNVMQTAVNMMISV
ncbi:MAG: hypothetical protein GY805_38475 [Chloroflexi bacterium]|nr:hypothetical protein [Chloroflexota bacterium]